MGIGSEVVVEAWTFQRVKDGLIWIEKRRWAYHLEDWTVYVERVTSWVLRAGSHDIVYTCLSWGEKHARRL